jgi:hypothetical protein
MRQITNITAEPIQRHLILFNGSEITLTLRFYPKAQMWCFDAEYNGRKMLGLKLTCGVLHMLSQNQPFDFIVADTSGEGLDPFRWNDFSGGRCKLYILESDDMTEYRGVEVPV